MGFIFVMNYIFFIFYIFICYWLWWKYIVNVNGYSIVCNGYMLKIVFYEKILDSFGVCWGWELFDIFFNKDMFEV